MKKVIVVVLSVIVMICVAFLGFNTSINAEPNTYYQVYMDGELLGVINSKKELEKYINKTQTTIKDKYKVKDVLIPNGLEIKKIVSYNDKLSTVNEIYNKIQELKPFTIKGYQVTINNGDKNQKIYVIDEKIFDKAVESTIKAFVGTEDYNAYRNKTQNQISTTGKYINNIYVENDITIKEVNISVNEKIYTDSDSLAKYLLFGTTENQKKYKVKLGDTIEQVAFDNQISVEEFLMSNPEYTTESNLLYVGQEVTIGITDPQIKVTVEEKETFDFKDRYQVIEKEDSSKYSSYEKTVQEGEDGLLRITQDVKITNGIKVYIKQVAKQELKPSINKIVVKGTKRSYGSGSGISNINISASSDWAWPTESGWQITSGFSYRIDPFTGRREIHGAIDISGPGYGSKIYAANNGIVEKMAYTRSAGMNIVINHKNGYWTQYNHLSRYANIKVGQAVTKGQLIGYMGMTGAATGPHLHFALWKGGTAYRGTRVNPLQLYQ